MIAIQGIIEIFGQFFLSTLIGVALLVIALIVLYFAQDAIRALFYKLWSFVHKNSYTDFKRREEAEKKFKENLQ